MFHADHSTRSSFLPAVSTLAPRKMRFFGVDHADAGFGDGIQRGRRQKAQAQGDAEPAPVAALTSVTRSVASARQPDSRRSDQSNTRPRLQPLRPPRTPPT